jgi:hypothetical protein
MPATNPNRRKMPAKFDSLRVAEEGFEAVVHVLLDVTVEEGEAGLIGGEVDGGATVIGDDYRVLDDA